MENREAIKDEAFERAGRQGLSQVELERPLETMFSAGLLKVWQTRQALSFKKGSGDGRGHSYALPLWQQLTGLFPEAEVGMNPNARAEKIAGLIEKVERLLRYELRAFEKRRAAGGAGGDGGGGVATGETPVVRNEESRWARPTRAWDPVRAICFELGIAARRLSSYCKEISGLSISQLVDAIRAEELRKKLKTALSEFVRGWKALGDTSAATDGDKSVPATADEIYAALKETRRGPRFHRTTWATGLEFSSYPRMFLACVLCHGMTPHQLEIELIEEILGEMSTAGNAENAESAMKSENGNMCVLRQNDETKEMSGGGDRRAG